MHVQSIIAALALPAFINAAALPQDPEIPNWDENSADIVGGVAAVAGDVPYIVSLQLGGSHFCGASLLNANTVVTAAHCVYGRTGSSWRIRAGSLNRGSGGTLSTVSSIKINPSYNSDTSDYDIAILKLATPVSTSSTIGYATLAASGSDPSGTLTVAGWGDQTDGGNDSPTLLRKVSVPVVARATCKNNYAGYTISDRMFCAAASGKDSCQGDSGGPIYDASKVLVGIVSWGFGCAQPGKPGVYSRVGTLSSFITSNL